MADLKEFIDLASKQLGVTPGAATAGAGGLLQVLKGKLGDVDFGKLAGAIPGAADAVKAAPAGGGGGGLLGGLLQKAGAALGGGAGSALGTAAALEKAGIAPDKIAGFASAFVTFLKSKLPPDLLKAVLAKTGDLGKLLG